MPDDPFAGQDITGNWLRMTGMEIVSVSGDEVVGRLEVRPDHHQPYGIVHGGVYATLVETVASVAAAAWFHGRGQVVGVQNTTHFLRATRSGTLDIVASPVHRGRTQQLWEVRITDELGRLVSKGEVRLANIADAEVLGQG